MGVSVPVPDRRGRHAIRRVRAESRRGPGGRRSPAPPQRFTFPVVDSGDSHRIRQQHVVGAQVQVLAPAPYRDVDHAGRGLHPLHGGDLSVHRLELHPEQAGVQEAEVDRVGLVLVDLEPVAGGVANPRDSRGLGMLEGVEDGEGRAFLRWTHVGEHQAPPHLDRVGALAEPVADRAVGKLPGGVEDGAVDVEVPAVVAAADAALLDLAELERGAPVHAAPFQHPDPPACVAEHHQVLAEDPDGPRKVLELRFDADGLPEAAQVLPAGRSVSHAAKLIVRMAVAGAVVGAVGTLEGLAAFAHGVWSWPGGGDADQASTSFTRRAMTGASPSFRQSALTTTLPSSTNEGST